MKNPVKDGRSSRKRVFYKRSGLVLPLRIYSGGSWANGAQGARMSERDSEPPKHQRRYQGFRIVKNGKKSE